MEEGTPACAVGEERVTDGLPEGRRLLPAEVRRGQRLPAAAAQTRRRAERRAVPNGRRTHCAESRCDRAVGGRVEARSAPAGARKAEGEEGAQAEVPSQSGSPFPPMTLLRVTRTDTRLMLRGQLLIEGVIEHRSWSRCGWRLGDMLETGRLKDRSKFYKRGPSKGDTDQDPLRRTSYLETVTEPELLVNEGKVVMV